MRHVTDGPADQYLLLPENQSLTAKALKAGQTRQREFRK